MPRDLVAFPVPVALPSLEELLETDAHLRRWLESKRPDEVVGRCFMPASCLIARFLADHGIANANVHPGPPLMVGAGIFRGEQERGNRIGALPEWARETAKAFDRLAFYRTGDPVTASQALALLSPSGSS